MADEQREEITILLHRWNQGDRQAFDRLVGRLHETLRQLAHGALMKEYRGSGLETAELLNEAYILLVDKQKIPWQNRAHFFNVAAQAMRWYLLDEARRRHSRRRGGDQVAVAGDGELAVDPGLPDGLDPETLLMVNQVLEEVEDRDPELAKVVTMRYFAGFTVRGDRRNPRATRNPHQAQMAFRQGLPRGTHPK